MTQEERLDNLETLLRQPELTQGLLAIRKRCFDDSDWTKILDKEVLNRADCISPCFELDQGCHSSLCVHYLEP